MAAESPPAPRSVEELAASVRAAARDRSPVFVGRGALSLRSLDRIVAHEPGDLTITAEAGVTIAAIQDALAPHRQFVALDPPDPRAATLGGVIAAAVDGPMAARFGMARDQVLGVTVVNGDGRVTKAGGRVVKNVTGYDLCRLYAGSRGALGIIAEATVRVRPRPEKARRAVYEFARPEDALERAWKVRGALPEAASICVVRGAGPSDVRLSIFVAGLAPLVEALSAEADAACRPFAGRDVLHCDPLAFRAASPPAGATIVRLSALPAGLAALAAEADPLLAPQLGSVWDVLRGVRESWHAPGRAPFLDEKRLDGVLAKHRATLAVDPDAGFAAALASRFPSQVPGGLELMRSLKAALDPAGILNPGVTVFG
jgi:FAD/FMN-containing dehydrogenase